MNKFGIVLGVAAVATLSGCKDPQYNYNFNKNQNEAKSIETDPVAEPAAEPTAKPAVEPVSEPEVKVEAKKCECAPGTKHTEPCQCGADDCKCIVEAPAPIEETTVYIVQRGDYLAKISKKYNVTISSIKRLNPQIKNDVVKVGQKIKLPGKVEVGEQKVPMGAKAAPAEKKAAPAKSAYKPYTGATKDYVVKSGDFLGKIAHASGISVRQLKELNGLATDSLKVGQKLKVPAEKQVKAVPEKKSAPSKEVAVAKKSETPAKVDNTPVVEPVADSAKSEEATPVNAEPAPASGTETVESTPAASAPAAVATVDYVVKEDEDIAGIAIENGISRAQIIELNNFGEDAEVKAGQVIKLPADVQQ